jgi:hypothetical protein
MTPDCDSVIVRAVLIWLLRVRPVTALSDATAAIEQPTGAVTMYRKHLKPPLGTLGDSLDDINPGGSQS